MALQLTDLRYEGKGMRAAAD